MSHDFGYLRPVVYGDWSIEIADRCCSIKSASQQTDHMPNYPLPDDRRQHNAEAVPFVGGDVMWCQLEQAFNEQNVVLLHGMIGSGKTATAVNFANWYTTTGGSGGPAMFVSCDECTSVNSLIAVIARRLRAIANGVTGLTEHGGGDPDAVGTARALRKTELFWIIDKLDAIPNPMTTPDELAQLTYLLSVVQNGPTRILLTSRDTAQWLGDGVVRVQQLPMEDVDACQLLEMASRGGQRRRDIIETQQIVQCSNGNPLVLQTLAQQGQLRKRTSTGIGALSLRNLPHDCEKQLAAALQSRLGSGVANSVSPRLAALSLFRRFVSVSTLPLLGADVLSPSVEELRGCTEAESYQALEKGVSMGLLTYACDGWYSLHPAAPALLAPRFQKVYSTRQGIVETSFVEAMAYLAAQLHAAFQSGEQGVATTIGLNELTFLGAAQLAYKQQRWPAAIALLSTLRQLYEHVGQMSMLSAIVNTECDWFLSPVTEKPIPGRECGWHIALSHRGRLARAERRYEDQVRDAQRSAQHVLKDAEPYLAKAPHELTEQECLMVRSAIVALQEWGAALASVDDSQSVEVYENGCALALRHAETETAASIAENLGNWYLQRPAGTDLARARQWYLRSLELAGERNVLQRGRSLANIGNVLIRQCLSASERADGQDDKGSVLGEAKMYITRGLSLWPPSAREDTMLAHANLGLIESLQGNIEGMHREYTKALACARQLENIHMEAQLRHNLAIHLKEHGCLEDAREYAVGARKLFRVSVGIASEQGDVEAAERLVQHIDRLLQSGASE